MATAESASTAGPADRCRSTAERLLQREISIDGDRTKWNPKQLIDEALENHVAENHEVGNHKEYSESGFRKQGPCCRRTVLEAGTGDARLKPMTVRTGRAEGFQVPTRRVEPTPRISRKCVFEQEEGVEEEVGDFRAFNSYGSWERIADLKTLKKARPL